MSLLTVSGSPHVHDSQSVSKIMFGVVISLIPAMLVSFYFFGLAAILLTLTAVVSCMAVEFVIQKYLMKGPVTIFDGSAVITGVLLAFNVPANLPLWMVVIGSIVAIGVGKMTFGGLGKNPQRVTTRLAAIHSRNLLAFAPLRSRVCARKPDDFAKFIGRRQRWGRTQSPSP